MAVLMARDRTERRSIRALGAIATLAIVAGAVLATPVAAADRRAAKHLFGAQAAPAPLKARAIGFYSRGCLAGGKMLPVDGPAWQAMRLSRNRNWGHPDLIKLVERLAVEAKEFDGWPGLLVGDLAQPRGGPMTSGHASHQIGLDADIWLMPMRERRLTREERERISAVSVLKGPLNHKARVNEKIWTDAHFRILRRAASYPEVARIFVHPAIKRQLCEQADDDRAWLRTIRPYYGHHYHFHIRMKCPTGSVGCRDQKPPPAGDGCGDAMAYWFSSKPWIPAKPPKPGKKPPKRRDITMAELPNDCAAVLSAGGSLEPPPLVSAGTPLPPRLR